MDRYIRHKLLSEFGVEGQSKLSSATIAIVGCGGLGNIAAAYLAGAGIGHLILIDGDSPDITNVHRQIFYTGSETETKAGVLKHKLDALNPSINITIHEERLSKSNCENLLADADIVLECTDDVMCKYLVNDFCALESIPMIYGAIHKYEGYVSVFRNLEESDIHLRDIFPQPDLNIPNCSEVGVLNTIAGLIGIIQANEAIKFLAELGTSLEGTLLTYNVLTYDQLKLKINKSWDEDLEDVWEQSEYTSMDCLHIDELSWEKVKDHQDQYQLVSIMPAAEHQNINESVIHLATNEHEKMVQIAGNKPVIIYCRSGKKSKVFISQVLESYPTLRLYNLEGGYMNYQKTEALG
jgi:adenylyltransferase/sulfurtransferase